MIVGRPHTLLLSASCGKKVFEYTASFLASINANDYGTQKSSIVSTPGGAHDMHGADPSTGLERVQAYWIYNMDPRAEIDRDCL
jgi:hypothetical protein